MEELYNPGSVGVQKNGKTVKVLLGAGIVCLLLLLIGLAAFAALEVQKNKDLQAQVSQKESQLSQKEATIVALNATLANVKNKTDLLLFLLDAQNVPARTAAESIALLNQLQAKIKATNDVTISDKFDAIINGNRQDAGQQMGELMIYILQSLNQN